MNPAALLFWVVSCLPLAGPVVRVELEHAGPLSDLAVEVAVGREGELVVALGPGGESTRLRRFDATGTERGTAREIFRRLAAQHNCSPSLWLTLSEGGEMTALARCAAGSASQGVWIEGLGQRSPPSRRLLSRPVTSGVVVAASSTELAVAWRELDDRSWLAVWPRVGTEPRWVVPLSGRPSALAAGSDQSWWLGIRREGSDELLNVAGDGRAEPKFDCQRPALLASPLLAVGGAGALWTCPGSAELDWSESGGPSQALSAPEEPTWTRAAATANGRWVAQQRGPSDPIRVVYRTAEGRRCGFEHSVEADSWGGWRAIWLHSLPEGGARLTWRTDTRSPLILGFVDLAPPLGCSDRGGTH